MRKDSQRTNMDFFYFSTEDLAVFLANIAGAIAVACDLLLRGA